MGQEFYAVENKKTGEVKLFFCKWSAVEYHETNESTTEQPIKIKIC